MQTLAPITLRDDGVEDTTIEQVEAQVRSGLKHVLRNVSIPTLTPYLPEPGTGTGTAVVVVPGGALHFLAIDNEGVEVARRLTEQGIAAFVLRYRLAPTPLDEAEVRVHMDRIFTDRSLLAEISLTRREPAMADGTAALRTVREHADEWGVDPAKVGMVGFSAGGFVTLATTIDGSPEDRPAFIAPIYPAWWGDIDVPAPALPMFLAWATDDGLGDTIITPCLDLYTAWRRAGAPVEAHAYADGGHGFGARTQGTASDAWFDAFHRWMGRAGF